MKKHLRPHRLVLALALAASAGAWAQKAPAALAGKTDKALMAQKLAAALQACSYDGSPVAFSPPDLSQGNGADGSRVVGEIMKYTGLPQNFAVVQGKVPNAAAVIMAGPDKIPRRVIAYNPNFMGEVSRATQNNNWAPISIMAHEIGHHLSGHTIVPGGSQPPIELEADKFSGFVLYKMGAPLTDAVKAIETLVPEQDGKTHPGRRRRIAAISEGWKQACGQQSTQCDGIAVAASRTSTSASTVAPARAAPAAVAAPAAPTLPTTPTVQAQASAPAVAPVPQSGPILAQAGSVDVIPIPGANATPAKFDRFVMDETGLMDPGEKAKLAKAMYDLARDKDVEVVTLLVSDLRGSSADEYAYAMMRQLRVGKMEVGNGVVLVVAPGQGQVGVALGAGLALEINADEVASQLRRPLQNFIDSGVRQRRGTGPVGAGWSSRINDAADYVRRSAKHWEWSVRYTAYDDYAKVAAEETARSHAGNAVDPAQSQAWRKLVRVAGVLNSANGPKSYPESEKFRAHLVESAPKGGRVIELVAPNGDVLIASLDAHTQQMMTAALAEGKPYQFTLRAKDPNKRLFHVLSYDALE